jgi:hypothetical protein
MNDPVRECEVYKNIGCSHVDGYLCDYPDCSIRKNYMNQQEKILELARKAGLHVNRDGEIGHAFWGSVDAGYKKFAELIVRECMDIAREVGTSTEPEDFALDRCYEIETKIKEHFGVEE